MSTEKRITLTAIPFSERLFAAVTAALIYLAYRTAPIGYLCAAIAQIASIMKYYKIVQYNSLTVKRFRNSYQGELDAKKFNRFVEKNF